jgi:hypothetical protein
MECRASRFALGRLSRTGRGVKTGFGSRLANWNRAAALIKRIIGEGVRWEEGVARERDAHNIAGSDFS